jgi:MFS family permease
MQPTSLTPDPAIDQQPIEKLGRFRKSWLLTQAAWSALRLDKEILSLPLMSFFLSLIPFALAGVVCIVSPSLVFQAGDGNNGLAPFGYVVFALVGLVVALIGTFISGAVIHAALDRFRGNDPNVSSSLAAARRHLGSLAAFAVFSYTIGYILQFIAERVPFLGAKIVTWLADAAWGVASFFALPVIMDSEQPVNPITATKQSIQLIRKTWGESLIASASIGIISGLTVMSLALITGLLVGVGVAMSLSVWFLVPLAAIVFMVIVALSLVFSVLTAFVKAAIYYYAITGESPVNFQKHLLEQSFTRKQARKVFGA